MLKKRNSYYNLINIPSVLFNLICELVLYNYVKGQIEKVDIAFINVYLHCTNLYIIIEYS